VAAKLILDDESEVIAFVGPRTEDGKLVYSKHRNMLNLHLEKK